MIFYICPIDINCTIHVSMILLSIVLLYLNCTLYSAFFVCNALFFDIHLLSFIFLYIHILQFQSVINIKFLI